MLWLGVCVALLGVWTALEMILDAVQAQWRRTRQRYRDHREYFATLGDLDRELDRDYRRRRVSKGTRRPDTNKE